MKTKRILKGLKEIREMAGKLRSEKEITEDSLIQIEKLLERAEWLTNPPHTLSVALMIFIVLLISDKIFDMLSQSIGGFLVFLLFLVSFSIFFPKLIFLYPRRKAIAELGEALQVHELLKSLFIKHFCPTPEEAVAYAKKGWVSPGRRDES